MMIHLFFLKQLKNLITFMIKDIQPDILNLLKLLIIRLIIMTFFFGLNPA